MILQLGKIESVSFGIGGCQDAMIGIHVTLSGDCVSVSDSRSSWDANIIKRTPHLKWTEEDRSKQYDEIMRYVSDLLAAAKVKSVDQLKGIPVEITFEGEVLAGSRLKSWRVLTEVL